MFEKRQLEETHTHMCCACACVCVAEYVCCQFVLCAWRDLQFPSELLPRSPMGFIVRAALVEEGEGKLLERVVPGKRLEKRTNCSAAENTSLLWQCMQINWAFASAVAAAAAGAFFHCAMMDSQHE